MPNNSLFIPALNSYAAAIVTACPKSGRSLTLEIAEKAIEDDEGIHHIVLGHEGAFIEFEHEPIKGIVWILDLETPADRRRQGLMTCLVRALLSCEDVRVINRGVKTEDGAAFGPTFTREIETAGKVNKDEYPGVIA